MADAVPVRAGDGHGDSAQIARLLEKIEAMVADTDSEAAESAEALFRMVQGTPMAVTVGRMATALSAYDFETAMAELASLKPAT